MTSTTTSLPVTTTWDTLQRSRNEAAIQVLAGGLKSELADLRYASLQAIAARKEKQAGIAMIQNWSGYDERDLEFLRTHKRGLSSACSHILESGSYAEKQFALAAINALDLHELVDRLLELTLGPRSPISKPAADCLLDLCARCGQKARLGTAARSLRRMMIELLHSQLLMYHEHQNPIVLDAWLKLVHWDDSEQRGLMSDVRLDAYWAIMERLTTSHDPAVMQLLAGYLGRRTTPQGVAQIISERSEPEMLIALAELADDTAMPAMQAHLSRLAPLASIQSLDDALAACPAELQHRIWLLVAASSDDVSLVLRAATQLAGGEGHAGQSMAARILRSVRHNDLPTLVPALQQEHTSASGNDSLGSLLREVASWVDGPAPVLRAAAKKFLEQFSVANLLSQVRVWPAQMCRAMAEIVRIVEPQAAEVLAKHLQNPSPRRRLDALQVTRLLDAATDVSDVLLPMLDDPRLSVRVCVIDLLGSIRYEPLQPMLPKLLDDTSTDIQDAARRALRRLKRERQAEIARLRREASTRPFASQETSGESSGSELSAAGADLR